MCSSDLCLKRVARSELVNGNGIMPKASLDEVISRRAVTRIHPVFNLHLTFHVPISKSDANMTSALNGKLHVYNRPRSLTCFESADLTGTNALIFLGGLGTGFASLDLLPRLSASLPSKWSFVQASTRSSYTGFLSSKLDETPEDLHDLEVYLRQDVGKSGRMAVMGCSKGPKAVMVVQISQSFVLITANNRRQ